jgi:serine/threonine protein phosphatase PrpC
LLGVAPSAALIRPAARTELAPGSTLLLFTDGLVEVPGESLTDSIERLKLLAAEAGPVSPDTLVDRLTSALPDGQRRDDVAVIAIRLTGAADPQPAASDGSGTEGAGRGLPG